MRKSETDPSPAVASSEQREITEPLQWLEQYGDYLFRFAMQRIGSRELAEDLVQDTLLSAYRAFDGFEGKASVKTWLVSILKNKIIDHLRRAGRVQFVSLEGMTDGDTADDSFNMLGIWKRIPPSWGLDPGEVAQSKDFLKQLGQCIDVLPDSMRSVFSLKTMDQLSTSEICELLDISENNVWVILHRARQRVRQCLETNWLADE